jgi:hypothetical protein
MIKFCIYSIEKEMLILGRQRKEIELTTASESLNAVLNNCKNKIPQNHIIIKKRPRITKL